MRTLALAFANHGWSHEVATLALLASSALRIADSRVPSAPFSRSGQMMVSCGHRVLK